MDRKGERLRIRAMHMDNVSSLWGIRRMDRVLNMKIRERIEERIL